MLGTTGYYPTTTSDDSSGIGDSLNSSKIWPTTNNQSPILFGEYQKNASFSDLFKEMINQPIITDKDMNTSVYIDNKVKPTFITINDYSSSSNECTKYTINIFAISGISFSKNRVCFRTEHGGFVCRDCDNPGLRDYLKDLVAIDFTATLNCNKYIDKRCSSEEDEWVEIEPDYPKEDAGNEDIFN